MYQRITLMMYAVETLFISGKVIFNVAITTTYVYLLVACVVVVVMAVLQLVQETPAVATGRIS